MIIATYDKVYTSSWDTIMSIINNARYVNRGFETILRNGFELQIVLDDEKWIKIGHREIYVQKKFHNVIIRRNKYNEIIVAEKKADESCWKEWDIAYGPDVQTANGVLRDSDLDIWAAEAAMIEESH